LNVINEIGEEGTSKFKVANPEIRARRSTRCTRKILQIVEVTSKEKHTASKMNRSNLQKGIKNMNGVLEEEDYQPEHVTRSRQKRQRMKNGNVETTLKRNKSNQKSESKSEMKVNAPVSKTYKNKAQRSTRANTKINNMREMKDLSKFKTTNSIKENFNHQEPHNKKVTQKIVDTEESGEEEVIQRSTRSRRQNKNTEKKTSQNVDKKQFAQEPTMKCTRSYQNTETIKKSSKKKSITEDKDSRLAQKVTEKKQEKNNLEVSKETNEIDTQPSTRCTRSVRQNVETNKKSSKKMNEDNLNLDQKVMDRRTRQENTEIIKKTKLVQKIIEKKEKDELEVSEKFNGETAIEPSTRCTRSHHQNMEETNKKCSKKKTSTEDKNLKQSQKIDKNLKQSQKIDSQQKDNIKVSEDDQIATESTTRCTRSRQILETNKKCSKKSIITEKDSKEDQKVIDRLKRQEKEDLEANNDTKDDIVNVKEHTRRSKISHRRNIEKSSQTKTTLKKKKSVTFSTDIEEKIPKKNAWKITENHNPVRTSEGHLVGPIRRSRRTSAKKVSKKEPFNKKVSNVSSESVALRRSRRNH